MINEDGKKIKKIVVIIFLALILIISLAIFFILKNNQDSKIIENEEIVYIKNYKVNEYIPVYISDEDMASIYLNDYINNITYDVKDAYNSLNEDYRKEKFPNINKFREYVSKLNYSSMKAKKYAVSEKNGYEYYFVYDQDNNVYIFKTDGVLQYELYLDSDTVDIYK